IQQLFGNLLDNSLKYTDSGGKVIIRLYTSDDQAVIDFEDSAPGVPNEELERLFERLYRVETSRSRATGGAGLGLSICKDIVDAHNGKIIAQPSSLGGILIKIYLPLFRHVA
ncbi:MAG: ATP-binding protein, partial [Thermodesulfovibrionales bacterium]|nr:ATP-binding protein [Thermodesulfovibrionales bacterium]